jgi:hypothetical protein
MSGSDPHNQPDEAMIDLLIKQVTEGLSPDEQRALDVLDSEAASGHLRELERAAAAIAVAGSAGAGPLPAALGQRLVQDAERHFAEARRAAESGGQAPAVAGAGAAAGAAEVGRPQGVGLAAPGPGGERASPRSGDGARGPSRSRSGAWGWLAAAACLVLAIMAWNRQPAPPPVAEVKPPPTQVAEPPPSPPVPPAPPTPAEERTELLAKADAVKVTLGATHDPSAAGMSGDVVWDQATQRGFVRFAGLAPNDPAVHQYQLWIFDGARDKRYPVDGGVFDIPAHSHEVVIPIHAALQVISPKAFAVTVEKPGGVVVSGREHVVALGATG